MSELVLIDSSAWIFVLGKRPIPVIRNRVSDLLENNKAAVTSPILFELLSYPLTEGGSQQLTYFLSSLHVFPFAPPDWISAAHWVAKLRKKGLKIKTIDALIGFVAHKHHLTLLHTDTDLDRLARHGSVQVESYVQTARQWSKS